MAHAVFLFAGLSGVVSLATVAIGYMAEKAYRARRDQGMPGGRHTIA